MRKAKLYQLLAVAGGLSVAVASTPAWAKGKPDTSGSSGDSSLTAVPLNWTAGTATVDGDISEWDLSGGNIMCTRGSINADGTGCDGNGKEHLSTAYLRYDCSSNTMYVLVLKEDGYEAQGDRWVKVYDIQQSEYQDQVADVVVGGENLGYEASFSLAPDTTYDSVEIHMNVSANTSSTGKISYTRSISGLDSCEMPVVEDPVDEPTDPVDEPTDPVDEPTDPVDEPTDPVDEPTSGGGNPNMACSEIMGSNGVPMSLVAKYETNGSGAYVFEGSGTDIINITDANLSGGTWSVEGGVVKVGAIIVKGGTDTDVDQDGNDSFSNDGLENGGGNTPDISNIQFCEVPVFDASKQVCLWSANKDADGNYTNIVQEGCTDAEQGKFYAIEAGGEFSSALEAE